MHTQLLVRRVVYSTQMVFQMSIGDNPEYETEIWRRDPIFGTIFYWLVNLLSALFLMNVFLSIVVDGFITANEVKEDESSILETTGNVLRHRKPKDLGYVRVPQDPQEKKVVLSVQAKMDRGRRALDTEIRAIVNGMHFTRRSIKKGRIQVLEAIDKHMHLRCVFLERRCVCLCVCVCVCVCVRLSCLLGMGKLQCSVLHDVRVLICVSRVCILYTSASISRRYPCP